MRSGNVGIGTTSPSKKLHVKESSTATYAAYIENTIAGGDYLAMIGDAGDNVFEFDSGGTGGEAVLKMYSDGVLKNIIQADGHTYFNGGNVGIGTASPTAPLHVIGTVRMGNTSEGLTFTAGSGIGNIIGVDTGFAGYNAIALKASANTGIYLDTADNVGIGTTSPGARLEVAAGQADTIINSTTAGSASRLRLKTTTREWRLGTHSGQSNNLWVYDSQASAYRFVINTSGNVGIGTTNPTQKLDVNGDIAVKGASVINRASAALTIGDIAGTDSVTNLTLTTAGRNTEVFLDDSGNVGINTATPSYNLTVDSGTNDIGILTASSDSGSYVGFLDDSTSTIPKIGAVGNKLVLDASQYVGVRRTDPSYALDVNGTIRATGNVIAYSDARVKENVETIPNALDKVKAMRGVGYNKIGEEKRSIGVIAQELLEVVPEAVHQDEKGMYSVAYGNLVGVLVEAMKEQQQQIDELKALIASK